MGAADDLPINSRLRGPGLTPGRAELENAPSVGELLPESQENHRKSVQNRYVSTLKTRAQGVFEGTDSAGSRGFGSAGYVVQK